MGYFFACGEKPLRPKAAILNILLILSNLVFLMMESIPCFFKNEWIRSYEFLLDRIYRIYGINISPAARGPLRPKAAILNILLILSNLVFLMMESIPCFFKNEWIRSYEFLLDRIYRINGIIFRLRREGLYGRRPLS